MNIFLRIKNVGLSFCLILFIVIFAATIGKAASSKIVFSADGSRFLSANDGFDNLITLWETKTGKQIQKFTMASAAIYTNFMPDGKTVFSADASGNIIWSSIETGKPVKFLTTENQRSFYALSPDGKFIAAVFNRRDSKNSDKALKTRVDIYESVSGKLKKSFSQPFFLVSCVSFFPNGEDLLIAGDTRTSIVSVKTGRIKKDYERTGVCWSCDVSPDGKTFLLGGKFSSSESDFIQIINLRKNEKHISFDAKYQSLFDKAAAIGFSPINPNTALIGGGERFEKDGILIIWDTKSGKIKQFYRNKSDLLSAVFSPDGETIVFGDISGRIFLLDVESGIIIREYSDAVKENTTTTS